MTHTTLVQSFRLRHGAALFCAVALSACGGGGGGSGSNATPTPPVVVTSVTSSNYMQVAAQAFGSADGLAAQSGLNTGVQNGGGADLNLPRQLASLTTETAGVVASLPNLDNTFNDTCSNGGNVSLQVHLAQAGKLSNGASLTVNANNCNESGTLINGGLVLQPGDNPQQDLKLTFSTLSVQSGSARFVMNGDSTLKITAGTYSQTGNSMYIAYYNNGTLVTERTLSNYNVSMGNGSFAVNGTLQSKNQALGTMTLKIQTQTPFIGPLNSFPQSGKIVVTGSGAGTVTLTPVGGSSVRIDYSDGTQTLTQTTTFTQLRAML